MAGCDGSSKSTSGASESHGLSPSDQLSSPVKNPQALAGVLDYSNLQESSHIGISVASSVAVSEGSSFPGTSPPGTPTWGGSSCSSVRTTESKIDEVYERQTQVQQVAEAQVHAMSLYSTSGTGTGGACT